MRNYLKYGLLVFVVIFIVAGIFYLATPKMPTIKSDVFSIEDWNHPEYIENNVFSVNDGVVIKEMPSESENLYDCIIEVPGSRGPALVYYVDTIHRAIGDSVNNVEGIKIGTYNYEESVDMVRRVPVYLSKEAIKLYK